jgi:hypothetical protein
MRYLLSLCTFLCCAIVSAQDYNLYYAGINKAKLALVEDSLEIGVAHYANTFQKFDFAFARDCFNALEVACILRDTDNVDYFIRRCMAQGVGFELLAQDSMLTFFKATEHWRLLLNAKDSIRNSYVNQINWEVRAEVNSMFAQDQKIRDSAYKNRFNVFKIRRLKKQLEALDRILVLRLLEITQKYGFPGEKLIGLDTESMHPKINDQDINAGMPIVIFIHHFSQPNESFNKVLIDQLRTGNLSNEHYAIISDFQYEYGKERFGKVCCYSQRFSSKESTEVVNRNRKEIGLLDISNTYKLQKKKYITPFWMRLR